MAIETQTVNNSFTEIHVGGGNFITQSYPTNFHQFYKRKILTASESIEDFKEITEAEKLALEKSDAKWKRPPQSFIDEWSAACYETVHNIYFGKYNETTGYFEYGDVKDLTYEDAIEALQLCILSPADYPNRCKNNYKVRVLMCRYYQGYAAWTSFSSCCQGAENMEYACLSANRWQGAWPSEQYELFSRCFKLRTIEPYIVAKTFKNTNEYIFSRCYALENVRLYGLQNDLSIADSPNLTLDSIEYAITNRDGSKAITITLHPDAYARVTDELFALAAEKNITIATT